MAIPETQLETWAKQGSISQSSITYEVIRNALNDRGNEFSHRNYSIFLQGSYSNDTNVYSESDVDIVICFSDIFYYDIDLLSLDQRAIFHNTLTGNSGLIYDDFKNEVYRSLASRFGRAVNLGSNAITIAPNGNRRKCDVLVAVEYRRYNRYAGLLDNGYTEGICFFNSSGTRIENYPKIHSSNCIAKHQGSGRYFKPVVRIMKNIRNKLIESSTIPNDLAPSYFIEGLFYNVPNSCFAGEYSDTLISSINWLLSADKSKFVCANERHSLYGNFPVCWSFNKSEEFIGSVVKYWNNWS